MIFRTRKTYITSDLHFGHANICRYCNRPYAVQAPNKNPVNAPLLKQMEEDILQAFDNLPEECDVWNLGDVFFFQGNPKNAPIEDYRRIVDRMKGPAKARRLFLVKGNHDGLKNGVYRSLGFNEVYDTPILVEDIYLLSHEPVYVGKDNTFVNLYGHTHDKDIEPDYFCYDYENYAKTLREAKMKHTEPPPPKKVHPEREYTEYEFNSYINCCIDKHKGILEWDGCNINYTGNEVKAWIK